MQNDIYNIQKCLAKRVVLWYHRYISFRGVIYGFQQLHYTTNREEISIFVTKKCCIYAAENFEQLSYPDFLNQRRILMAQIVKKAYEKLCKQRNLIFYRENV